MALPTNINWNDVQENQGGASKRPEPGGYVAKVIGIQDVTDNSGSYLNVDFDIAEGEFAGHYAALYRQFPQRWGGHIRLYYKYVVKATGEQREDYGRVKAFKTALENSNGITIEQFTEAVFDAAAKRRLLFGVLMGYDQKEHRYLNAYQVRSVQAIREGDYEIPDEWKVRWAKPPANNGGYGGYGSAPGYGGASSGYGYGGNGNAAPPPPDESGLPF